jgi:hypothetical protein
MERQGSGNDSRRKGPSAFSPIARPVRPSSSSASDSAVGETGPKRPNERARSTLPGWRKIQQGVEGGPVFLHRQPSRCRLRLRQALPVSSAPGFGALALDCFLLGDRRVTRQLVVDDDGWGQIRQTVSPRWTSGPQPAKNRLPDLTPRIDRLPITIIDGSRGLHTAEVPVASSLCS